MLSTLADISACKQLDLSHERCASRCGST